jgi:hypothetical protein
MSLSGLAWWSGYRDIHIFPDLQKKKQTTTPDWKFQIGLIRYNFTDALFNSCYVSDDIQGVDKITDTLRNSEIEFVLATLKELQLSTLNVLLPFVHTV